MTITKNNEQLPEDKVDGLITTIVSRTREHPDIKRGASVRGTIAFKEVLQGFKEIQSGLTRSTIEKAAITTLPHRIYTKQGDYKSAIAIISDIVKEILYGIRFSKQRIEKLRSDKTDRLSPDDVMAALKNLSSVQVSQEQNVKLAHEDRTVIVPDKDNLQELSGYLVSNDLLQEKDEKQSLSTPEAIEHLMKELGQMLRYGEITEDEYRREKGKLQEMLSAASQLQSRMSGRELAGTVMEFMDAKDEQWKKELSFSDMYVYYHIKGTCKRKQLSPPKRGQYGLRVVIDYLEKQGILRTVKTGQSFTLTSKGLDELLEHIIQVQP